LDGHHRAYPVNDRHDPVFKEPGSEYRRDQVLSYDFTFFSLIHIALMFAAIIVLTVGSAMAKRQGSDRQKFRTMLMWFIFALVIILIAIPWPFSPLAKRPLIRF
jgi:drug/metabolite transporter (DMT)-like permease